MRSMRLILLLAFTVLILQESYGFPDEIALFKFKSQVSEDKKVVLSSWNRSFPLCNWNGVTCGRKHKRVTGLDLGGLQLGRVISPSIVEEIRRPSRTLTLPERLNIAIDVASALDYLHGIAHCDLKPSNVLLDDYLTAHVNDFGLARLLLKFDQEYFLNQSSSAGVRGTIGYAAPEYGMGGKPSVHGDVYSFGVLILEMFTGKRPTNQIFGENFTLHSFTKSALPERVLDIADESILQKSGGLRVGFPVAECLTLVLDVGLRCCEESPTNRLATSEATKELISIRERFFKSRITTRH